MARHLASATVPMQQRPLPALRPLEAKHAAYQAGRDARSLGLITAEERELYEVYVRCTGDNPYCWPSVAYLTEELHCSSATITRMNKALVAAQLIRRERTMGERSWHTFITKYDVAAPTLPTPITSITHDECDPSDSDECDPISSDGCDQSQLIDLNVKTNHVKTTHPKPDHPNHHHQVVVAVERVTGADNRRSQQPQATPPPRSAGPSPAILRLPTPAERPLFERLRAARHPVTGETVAHPLKVLDALAATDRLDLVFLERLLAYCGEHGRGFGLLLSLAGNPVFDPPGLAPPAAPTAETARPADNPADNDRYRQQPVDYGHLLAMYGDTDV